MRKCLECDSTIIAKTITVNIKGVKIKNIEVYCCEKNRMENRLWQNHTLDKR